jgi:hypothetical protein
MKKHVRIPVYILIACSMVLVAGLTFAEASPITYVFSGQGHGVFNDVEFDDAPFLINLTGDTSGVVEDTDLDSPFFGQLSNSGLLGTISVFGLDINLLETAFADPLTIFLDPIWLMVGIVNPDPLGYDLLDYSSEDLAGHDLRAAFGPIAASFTSASDIVLADGSVLGFEQADLASFAAVQAPVPEPTSLALLASGLFGLALLKMRKRSDASAVD